LAVQLEHLQEEFYRPGFKDDKKMEQAEEFESHLAKDIYLFFHSQEENYDGDIIRKWIISGDIEALALLYVLLNKKNYFMKIRPHLSFIDYFNLIKNYFTLCFETDHDHPRIISRYTAGRDLIGWFMSFWNDENIPRKYLEEMKEWLAKLYKEGDKDIKECLVTATLEHLFEDLGVLDFFSDWENDPELKEAYESAKEWWDYGKSDPKTFSILDLLGHKRK